MFPQFWKPSYDTLSSIELSHSTDWIWKLGTNSIPFDVGKPAIHVSQIIEPETALFVCVGTSSTHCGNLACKKGPRWWQSSYTVILRVLGEAVARNLEPAVEDDGHPPLHTDKVTTEKESVGMCAMELWAFIASMRHEAGSWSMSLIT